MKESIFLNRKQLVVIRWYLLIYRLLFQYWVFVFWGIISVLLLLLSFSVQAFSIEESINFGDIMRIKEQNLNNKDEYESFMRQESGINLIAFWGMVKPENSWFISQDNLLSVGGKFILPRIAGGETKKITNFGQIFSGDLYQNSDFSSFFQEILVEPLSFTSFRTKVFDRFLLTENVVSYFGLDCLKTKSAGSFVCQSALTKFLENFFVLEVPSTSNVSENTTSIGEENNSLLDVLTQIYPKVRYSHEKKKLFCNGVIKYITYWWTVNSALTDMMASCDRETFKEYSFVRDFGEINNGFLWGTSDGKFYNDLRLNQYKLFSLQQLLYKQIKWTAQVETILTSYLDFWTSLLLKEGERDTQLLDSFSKQFSHWYHQNLLLPYLRDDHAKVSIEQKNQLLTKLLQIENGDKNSLFKGIAKKDDSVAQNVQELIEQKVDIEQLFRANVPVQFILTSSVMSGDVLTVRWEDQVTNLRIEAELAFNGASLYVTKISIPKDKNLTEYVNTLLSTDKYSFLKMLSLVKDNQEIAQANQKFEINLCAMLQKEFGESVKKCWKTEVLMIKSIDTASGVNYRFLLKDNVLKGIEISDQTLQQQILSELDRKAVNRDTTFWFIQKIWNYELKSNDSWFGAKEQILVNDAFVKYFKQKPKKVNVVWGVIKIYFSIKEIDFIGQYDLATNRLSQISLDFGEVRKPIIVQRLVFDLNEKSVDQINAFLLDPIGYLKKINSRMVDVYFKDGKLTAPVRNIDQKSE